MNTQASLDPAINGLVALLSAHRSYLAAVEHARKHNLPLPTPPAAARLLAAEQVLATIKAGIGQYGDERERMALDQPEADPELYEMLLVKVLRAVAKREPAFGQQIDDLATQTKTHSGRAYAGSAEA